MRPLSGEPHVELDAPADLGATFVTASRASSDLTRLLATLSSFATDVGSVQAVGQQLLNDLGLLQQAFRQSQNERRELEEQVTSLTERLSLAHLDSELEHKYVRDEQDRFIASLIDDYEDQIENLKAASGNGVGSPSSIELVAARDQIQSLIQERESMRALVLRVQRQRDEAQKEQHRLRHELAAVQSRIPEGADDEESRHTRPTEPPPGAPLARLGDHLRARPSSDATPLPGSKLPSVKPASNSLDLSDLEEHWDAQATPAPPPGFDTTDLGANPFRTTSLPLEFRTPLADSGAPDNPAASVDEESAHIPAEEHVNPWRGPGAARPVQLPASPEANARPPGPSLARALTERVQQTANAHRASEPPRITTNVHPGSVYPELYPRDDRPPLKRKPDHSLRPLVGYSKGAGEVESERLSPVPSRPPKSSP